MTKENIFDLLRISLKKTIDENDLAGDNIVVSAKTLNPDEAIGNPEHDDYPLLVGRERMMEAHIRGKPGQAFTDMYGCWEGCLQDILNLELNNNYRRAVFVAVLNASLRYNGELDDTRHCKDEGPVECARQIKNFVHEMGLTPPFGLIGFQPRFAETLSGIGELRVVDLDAANIGQEKYGVLIHPPEGTQKILAGCRSLFVTGTTLVNNTIQPFLDLSIPTIFYGVTIAGAAKILGLTRYCAYGL